MPSPASATRTRPPTTGTTVWWWLPAIEDVTQLVEAVRARVKPDPTSDSPRVVGRGTHPRQLIDGALAACGADRRFDPGRSTTSAMPGCCSTITSPASGSAVDIPPQLRSGWTSTTSGGHRRAHRRPYRRSRACHRRRDTRARRRRTAAAATIAQVLWYNVFATEDAQQRLAEPYTNIEGGACRAQRLVTATSPSPWRAPRLASTTPAAACPARTLHTTGTRTSLHEDLYRDKAEARTTRPAGAAALWVARLGHCTFTAPSCSTPSRRSRAPCASA